MPNGCASVPALASILDRVRRAQAETRAGVRFEIGDRSGGHSDRFATLHAGPAPSRRVRPAILIAHRRRRPAGAGAGGALGRALGHRHGGNAGA